MSTSYRLLPWAHEKAEQVFNDGLIMAASWSPNSFGDNESLWRQAQGCVRSTVVLGKSKMSFYQKVPWLLSQLASPDVPAECVRQFEATAERNHESVTLTFLRPGSPLRGDIDAMVAGAEMSPRLCREVRSLREVSIDDSYAEAPHAMMNRVMCGSRASTWPRSASTLRLSQNL